MNDFKQFIAPQNYLIQPEHINTKQHLWNAFGRTEREISAGWIVRYIQSLNNGWLPFTYDELVAYYRKKRRKKTEEFNFNGLDGGTFLVEKNGRYYVTEEFVDKCFSSSKNRKLCVTDVSKNS